MKENLTNREKWLKNSIAASVAYFEKGEHKRKLPIVNLSPKRGENETFEDYVLRRAANNAQLKSYLKGDLVFTSCEIHKIDLTEYENGKTRSKPVKAHIRTRGVSLINKYAPTK